MTEILLQKLGGGCSLAAQGSLREWEARRRQFRPGEMLVVQGDVCTEAYFMLEGFACRSKDLGDGRRAVLAFLLPGDFCGLDQGLIGRMDHNIVCETPCTVAAVPRMLFSQALAAHTALTSNLATAILVQGAIQRQWLANMGYPSDKRTAHLLCELRARLAQLGLADDHGFALPLTQQELGDALGISTVHANRTLQHLKDAGLVRIIERRVIISDLNRLQTYAEFDNSYLAFGSAATSADRSATT